MPPLTRLSDIALLGIRRVFRQRQRYIGPALAVVLGIAGVMVVITMRGNIKKKANEDLDLLGAATILQIQYERKPLLLPWTGRDPFFHPQVARAVEAIRGVAVTSLAAPKTKPARVGWRDRQNEFPLLAADALFWQLHSFKTVEGEFFSKADADSGARVCVIGAAVARFLFDRETAAGEYILIDGELYRIAGVLDGFRVGEGSGFVFVPLTTALTRLSDMTLPLRLLVRCRSYLDVEAVAAEIPRAAGKYLHPDRLRVEGQWDNLERVKRVAFWLELFGTVCALATLLLGGIGIWNIQMAGVRARTREIGVKKAIGAENGDILLQFLTESVALCLGSALIGILLGTAAMEVISRLLESRPPLGLFLNGVALSVGFSLLVGLAAGILPAMKAGRMEVAAALRYD